MVFALIRIIELEADFDRRKLKYKLLNRAKNVFSPTCSECVNKWKFMKAEASFSNEISDLAAVHLLYNNTHTPQ